jgi:concanavalin A-like lectin/glucanase superfamily protein
MNHYRVVTGKTTLSLMQVSFSDGQPDYSSRRLNGTTALQPGAWYHIAAVIQGPEDMKLYLNGQDDGGDIAYADGASEIGSRRGTALFLHGAIDDLRIYHCDLTPEEIISLATSP